MLIGMLFCCEWSVYFHFVADGVCVYSHKASIQKDPDKYPVRQKKDLNTLELATAMAEHLKKIAGELWLYLKQSV